MNKKPTTELKQMSTQSVNTTEGRTELRVLDEAKMPTVFNTLTPELTFTIDLIGVEGCQ